jgi:hypothetical protein
VDFEFGDFHDVLTYGFGGDAGVYQGEAGLKLSAFTTSKLAAFRHPAQAQCGQGTE